MDRKKTIRFSPIQSEAEGKILKTFDIRPDELNSVAYISQGKIYYKSAAILNILKDLGGIWKIFYGFVIIPRFIRDALYDLIAKHRYRIFGKSESCMVSDENNLKRFL